MLFASDTPWQDGRIAEVQTENNGKVLYWIANTPVTKNDQVTYRISVHVKDKLYAGIYSPDRSKTPPPKAWVKNHPVKVQVAENTVFLQDSAGETLKLEHVKEKSAKKPMQPIRAEEWGGQAPKPQAPAEPVESMVGFAKPAAESSPASTPAKTADSAPADAPQTPAVEEAPATVSVSSSPYLADVYVDGKLEGYTPAKLSLSPGKHSIRLEKLGYKAWTTDVTVAAASQSTVSATLSVSKR
jgi:hypothetical protein